MRVSVYSGDGQTYLGDGEIVGYTTTYALQMADGSCISMENAEEYPQEFIDEFRREGIIFDLREIKGNPKILMDDGAINYGIQVWWQPEAPEI